MLKKFVALGTLIVGFCTPQTWARNEYLQWWGEVYTNSQSNDTACQLCHERAGGGNGWNRYGWSIRGAYFTNFNNTGSSETALKQALQDVANLNDGGVSSYLAEINSDSQPGWLVADNNRIRTRVVDSNGQPQVQETFISAVGVRPCGLFIDPPESNDQDEIRRVQSCSTTNPISTGIARGGPSVALELIADGFTAPVSAELAPDQAGVLYVVEQGGQVWRVEVDSGDKRLFLDFSADLVSDYGQRFGGYDERGLLGFAFHPDYSSNSKVYTYISTDFNAADVDFSTLGIGESADHMSEVAEWTVVNPLSANSQVTAKQKILAVAQPQFNHNGGMLAFGPEGFLYIALGDGGNRNDEGAGHGADGNARDNSNPLGAILRIDVDAVAPSNGRYGIPVTNPFANASGLDEIYVYGLRNPYRFSIETSVDNGHDLFIGDVGQDAIEELNRIPLSESASNFGWNYKEGSFYFSVIDGTTFVSPDPPPGIMLPPLVDPVAEYDHNEGISVIAGYVYRGNRIPALQGRYVFGDWGRSFASPDGRLFFLDAAANLREFRTSKPVDVHVTGFGRDDEGEIYVVGNKGFRVTDQGLGALLKLVPGDEEMCVPVKASNGAISLICL